MTTSQTTIDTLRHDGHRITSVRRAMIELFFRQPTPLAVSDIQAELHTDQIMANKTTIYREVAFLMQQKIIKPIQLGEDKTRYELAAQNHHHHLVCLSCQSIADVELANELDIEIKRIKQNQQFHVLDHALEFFGLCVNCQSI